MFVFEVMFRMVPLQNIFESLVTMPPKKGGGNATKGKEKDDQGAKGGKEKKGGTAVKVKL